MRITSSSWLLGLSSNVYVQLLKLYPRSYQKRYAQDMALTFSDCCHFAVKEGGFVGLFQLWIPTMIDFSLTVIARHLDEGLLSSGTMIIRGLSLLLLTGASVLFAVSWGSALELMLAGTLLLALGAFGLFVTSSEGKAMIARKLDRSDAAYDAAHKTQNPGRWMMTQKAESNFLRWWVAASGLGLVVGFAIFFMLAVNVAEGLSVGLQAVISLVSGLLLGAAIGLAQWLVLRRQVSQSRQWIIASSLGGATGSILFLLLRVITGDAAGYQLSLTLGSLAVGTSIGAAEWLILRRRVTRAVWWVAASALGLVVALSVSNVLGRALYDGILNTVGDGIATILAMIIFAGLLLLSYGTITGVVMREFLKQMGNQLFEAKAT